MRKAKWHLENYQCDNCDHGLVQVKQEWKRGGTVTSTVSGCLDCKKEFGLIQAAKLKPYEGDIFYWPN